MIYFNSKLSQNRQVRGFTLLEALIVIAIIGFLSTVGTYSLIAFQKDSQLTAFSEEFASTLKTAKNKSVNGEILPSQNISDFDSNNLPYWGITASSNSYSLVENCTKSDLTSCTQNVETINLDTGYAFLTTGATNFDRLTGKHSGTTSYKLQTPGNPDCSIVSIDTNGEVFISPNAGCI